MFISKKSCTFAETTKSLINLETFSIMTIKNWIQAILIDRFRYTSWDITKSYLSPNIANALSIEPECIKHEITQAKDGFPISSTLMLQFEDIELRYTILWKPSRKNAESKNICAVIQDIS